VNKTFRDAPRRRVRVCLLLAISTAAVLGACSYRPLSAYDTQQDLPEAIRVPAGHQAVLEARGSGHLLYECQAVKRAPYVYAWLLRSPGIELTDTYGNTIVYAPGPRTGWVHHDGSRISASAKESVEVTNDSYSLPLQRVKAEPSLVPGALQNISYVQRLRTLGGVVSVKACSAVQLGMRVWVPYEADYVFWRPVAQKNASR
jgi:Protein of unknown function (DUF3455)